MNKLPVVILSHILTYTDNSAIFGIDKRFIDAAFKIAEKDKVKRSIILALNRTKILRYGYITKNPCFYEKYFETKPEISNDLKEENNKAIFYKLNRELIYDCLPDY